MRDSMACAESCRISGNETNCLTPIGITHSHTYCRRACMRSMGTCNGVVIRHEIFALCIASENGGDRVGGGSGRTSE